MFHDTIVTWMVNFSSLTSHALLNFTQTYLYNFTQGLSVATPRPVMAARAQLMKFYRIMAEPAICRIRNRFRKNSCKLPEDVKPVKKSKYPKREKPAKPTKSNETAGCTKK
jgi:hypothetical protein